MVFLALILLVFMLMVWSRIGRLNEDVERLREEVRALRKRVASGAAPAQQPATAVWPQETEAPYSPQPVEMLAPTPAPQPEPTAEPFFHPDQTPEAIRQRYMEARRAEAAREEIRDREEQPLQPAGMGGGDGGNVPPGKGSFEFNFGQKLPVWIGGVALAFAGFFLVKYTIDQGWLTREVRIVLGLIFGCGMIIAASYIRLKKPGMADGARIGQALTGAGIADLYATIFTATMMFKLVPPLTGFIGMAFVTAAAVILSVRHGMPIAILGLLGGFLTPALIHTGHASAPMLFSYLFMLTLGFFTVIVSLAWWILAIPVLLLAFLWVPVWMIIPGYFHPTDGIYLGLFLLAVAALAIGASGKAMQTGKPQDTDWGKSLGYFALTGAIVLMAIVTARCDFALEDWALYALLGAGCFGLAYFRPALYNMAPWLTMVASLVMLAMWWRSPGMDTAVFDPVYAQVLLGFALLYCGGSFFLLRANPSLKSAGLLSASALSFYGLGYARLSEKIYPILELEKTEILHVWGFAAMALGGLFTLLTVRLMQMFRGDDALRQRLLAVSALTATAFLSIAMTIEVRHEFLAVAFAAQLLAVCWVNLKVDIRALRNIAAILFGVFVFLMGEQLLMLIAIIINSLFGARMDLWHGRLPLAEDPMFQLGLPMAMVGLSSYLVQRQRDGRLAEIFEMATVGLGALLLYYVMRNVFRMDDSVMFPPVGFFQRGVTTNLFFAAGLAVVYAGRHFSRRALVWSGTAVFLMAVFRVFWFDFLVSNPLFNARMEVGSAFLFNSLMFPYLLPCFWLWLEERPQLRLVTLSPVLRGGLMLALIFTYITLSVRQYFHGTVLAAGNASDAEFYTYSVVWLLLGALLLFFGTVRKDRPMRVASLVLVILTILKVFLFDASGLQGLYRVFSFMGLGLSLLALSWFYTRFVFKDKD
jgi:uncharacterized membrane protein